MVKKGIQGNVRKRRNRWRVGPDSEVEKGNRRGRKTEKAIGRQERS